MPHAAGFQNVFTIVALALVLSACATQAQRQLQQTANQLTVANDAATACYNKIKSVEAFQRLSKRFIMKKDEPGKLTKMAIEDYASKQEKEALIAYSAIEQECRSVALQEYGKVHPEYVILAAKLFTAMDGTRVKILKDEITVGKANQEAAQRRTEFDGEWHQIGQRITSQLQSAHQYEMQRRQAAAQALQTWSYQQEQLNYQRQQLYNQRQTINSLNRPIMTNCAYFGSTLSCTSY